MREDTVLSLKWHSFPSHLAVSLDTCYEQQQFVDLSLVCKDGTILKCHKMVLANSSSFFRRLLVANEHPHPMIILHDIEADDLKTIVNFMYCGEIQVVQSEVRRLLRLAEILEVTGLRHIQTSVLVGESNNENRKTTVSRLKLEENRNFSKSTPDRELGKEGAKLIKESNRDLNKELSTKLKECTKDPIKEHKEQNKELHKELGKEINTRQQQKLCQRFQTHKPQKKIEDTSININSLSQRLEIGKSGISIVDLNDIPSTSRSVPGVQSITQSQNFPQKRKEPDPVISWPRILSAISKDKPLPLKKLCIMDEVEITAGKPIVEQRRPEVKETKEQLDKRKRRTENSQAMKCEVYIKDEVDISWEVEEDVDMDPLEVEEVENDAADGLLAVQGCSYANIEKSSSSCSYSGGSIHEYSTRKGSNG